jgi:hypothetical protein
VLLAPDTPASVTGNGQYHLLAKVLPHDKTIRIDIQWPQSNSTHLPGFQYPHNENFSTVLDRVCFISPDRRNWRRLTNCQRTGTGARLSLPPSREARWLSVGIPYSAEDLNDLLAVADSSMRCQLTVIGTSRLGRPLHGIRIGPENPDACRGLFIIQAYQHHTEWAGLHALDELVRQLAAGYPGWAEFAWSIVPCVNIDALVGGWREDFMHLDLDHPNGGNFNRDRREFGAIGQTVESSRFRAWDSRNKMLETSQSYYRGLGPQIAEALASFYSKPLPRAGLVEAPE